jgi:nucleotide-binding universal stress UspA family protein
MVKRVLVPLYGSTVAESAIPLIADLARGAGAAVRLIHVAPMPENRYGADGHLVAYADQEVARVEAEQLDYLSSVEAGFAGALVERVVRLGNPVPEILEEAEQWGADLIAVTTAGRSGLGRVILGSVAEEVFRKARVPVILYHPARDAA